MLITVSPAKKMDMTLVEGITTTEMRFPERAAELAEVARDLSVSDLMKLMKISEALGKLNAERFANYGAQETKAAALAFAGDTYQGLEASSLEAEELAWAQDHFCILSGFYGLLRPLDAIEPYRLEMGSRLKNPRGKNLYEYWGSDIAEALNAQAEVIGTDTLINCASQEYFGAVDLKALKPQVITPVFMEEKAGVPKIVSFYAKRARGSMARFIIQNRLVDPQSIKDFDLGGYKFQPDLTEGNNWVFLRDEAAKAKAA